MNAIALPRLAKASPLNRNRLHALPQVAIVSPH